MAQLRSALGAALAALKGYEEQGLGGGSRSERDAATRRAVSAAEERVRASVTAQLESALDDEVARAREEAAAEAEEACAARFLAAEHEFYETHAAAVAALRAEHKLAVAKASVEASAASAEEAAEALARERLAHAAALATARAEAEEQWLVVETKGADAAGRLSDEFGARAAALAAQHDQALARQRAAFDAEAAEAEVRHAAALEARDEAAAAAAGEAEQAFAASREAPLRARVAALEEELTAAARSAEEEAAASEARCAALEAAAAEQAAAAEAARQKASAAHAATVAGLEAAAAAARASGEETAASAEARAADALAAADAAHGAKAARLAAEHARALACAEEAGDLRLQRAAEAHAEALLAARAAAADEVRASVEAAEAKEAELAKAEASAAALAKAHSKAMALARELADAAADAAEEEAGRLAREAAAREAALVERHAAELAEAREDGERAKASELRLLASELQASVESSGATAAEAKRRLAAERAQRIALHERVMELQGNIRVFARCRPVVPIDSAFYHGDNSENEGQAGQASPEPPAVFTVVSANPSAAQEKGFGEELVVRDVSRSYGAMRGETLRFEYDACFSEAASQEQVFDQVRPLVTSFLDGYNVCIFAYGQTGSGKTYTMEGGESPESQGINGRTLREAFSLAVERGGAQHDCSFSFRVEYLEVYNETVRDLFDGAGGSGLEVRQSADGRVHVPGLTSISISSPEELERLTALGGRRRAVGAHKMNDASSRSHAILTVVCDALVGGKAQQSRLHLVDLAGSERVAKTDAVGERLKEAQNINKTLSALGDVIMALSARKSEAAGAQAARKGGAAGAGHVPFRNSKLTYLLQDSLSGRSKVLMICTVAPSPCHVGESICSLNFAARCRAVQLGAAAKGGGASGDRARRALEDRIVELELQLRTSAAAGGDGSLKGKGNPLSPSHKALGGKGAQGFGSPSRMR